MEISIFILTVLRLSFLLEAVTLNKHTVQANKGHVSRKAYSYPENSGHHTLLFILSGKKNIIFPTVNIHLASYFWIRPFLLRLQVRLGNDEQKSLHVRQEQVRQRTKGSVKWHLQGNKPHWRGAVQKYRTDTSVNQKQSDTCSIRTVMLFF